MVQPAVFFEPGPVARPAGPAVGPKWPKIDPKPEAELIILSSLRSAHRIVGARKSTNFMRIIVFCIAAFGGKANKPLFILKCMVFGAWYPRPPKTLGLEPLRDPFEIKLPGRGSSLFWGG